MPATRANPSIRDDFGRDRTVHSAAMASRFDLVALLRRLAPVLESTFRRYGIPPDEAAVVLDEAVLEVQLRASRSPDCEGRLLRAVERGCTERVRRLRCVEHGDGETADLELGDEDTTHGR